MTSLPKRVPRGHSVVDVQMLASLAHQGRGAIHEITSILETMAQEGVVSSPAMQFVTSLRDGLEKLDGVLSEGLNLLSNLLADVDAATIERAERVLLVDKLTSSVSHDVHNVLTGIGALSDKALRRLDPDVPAYPHVVEIGRMARRRSNAMRRVLAVGAANGDDEGPGDLRAALALVVPCSKKCWARRSRSQRSSRRPQPGCRCPRRRSSGSC